MALRFAFDLGTSSLGWAVFNLDEKSRPVELENCGARIFSDGRDPQSGESKAKDRREPRAMRRSRDRFLQRQKYVLHSLINAELLPSGEDDRKALVNLNPYELRAQATKQILPLHHIGRALFHINQRRGFKSNRKTDNPEEGGKIKDAAKRLAEKMEGFETLGEYLASRQCDPDVRKRKAVRIRMDADNKEELYEFYPMRSMLEDEFDLICARQRNFNTDFPTEEKMAIIRQAIFCQRPLKEVKPGYCSFYGDQHRLARAHPLAEDWVFYQKINQLRAESDEGYPIKMSIEQRDEMIAMLKSGTDLTWTRARKIMGMSQKSGRINYEEGGEKNVAGSPLAKRFKGTAKKPGLFSKQWGEFSLKQIENILAVYNGASSDEKLLEGLADFNLDENQKQLALKCSLPDGYVAVCKRAAAEITAELKKDVITYSKACEHAGLHHSDKRDGEVFDRLPYYNEVAELKTNLGYGTGDKNDPRDIRFGRIANPTVHIGLNQLRRVINALMKRYGRPDQIVLELSRELKQSKKLKEMAQKNIKINRKANDERRKNLEDAGFFQQGDRRRTREAFIRMRLWEELGAPNERFCPYSGKPITSLNMLMSDDVEIEHILPRSRTLDDSIANKTIAFRQWNRLKRNLTPSEAADRFPDKFNQEDMIARTKTMPKNKRWRFHPDAMERFDDKDEFYARLLTETQYLGVMARKYLSKVHSARPDTINPETGEIRETRAEVWVTTGRLTSELRYKWGLNLGTNFKNRDDHRHHALDACVIGVIDRSLITKIATAAARDEDDAHSRILAEIDEPFPGYCDKVNQAARKVVISHRPDHRISGQLHEEAAYGLVEENEDNINRGEPDIGNVVIRRAITSLTEKQIGQVRDVATRKELEQVLYETRLTFPEDKDFKKQLPVALAQWSKKSGTRRVRTLKPAKSIVPIRKRADGSRYKYVIPGENHHMDIIETPDGKWIGVAVTIFEAAQDEQKKKKEQLVTEKWRDEYPDAKFIMRLHKGDTLQLFDEDGMNRVKRVVRISPSIKAVNLASHREAGNLQKRHDEDEKDDPFRWDFANIGKLKYRRARRVRVDETGRIRTIQHGK